MKNILLIIAAFTAITFASCKKYLDIKPQFKFGDNLALSTLDGLSKTTTGAFDAIQSGNLYGGGIIANSELLADFITTDPISDYSLNQLRTHQMNGFNSQASGMWNDAYYAIMVANTVLLHLPEFEKGADTTLVHKLRGECYFIRGAMHLELVRMFAQPAGYTSDNSHLGVPIILAPGGLTSQQSTPRSTVAQVYQQVITDLTAAEALLPAEQSARASKYAAQAFLMRAFFEQNKFSEAKTWADKIVTSSGASMNTDSISSTYQLTGSATNSETIFQIMNTTQDVSNGPLVGRFKLVNFPAQNKMSPSFITYIRADSTAGGLRSSNLYRVKATRYYTRKYDNVYVNVPVLRFAEVLLTRAECIVQLGGAETDARADYNQVRVRAGLVPDNSTSGQTALLAAIRGERDFELGMEGDRFFELKRRKTDFVTTTGTFPWNDNRLVYPIPQGEITSNVNMVQNPGY